MSWEEKLHTPINMPVVSLKNGPKRFRLIHVNHNAFANLH